MRESYTSLPPTRLTRKFVFVKNQYIAEMHLATCLHADKDLYVEFYVFGWFLFDQKNRKKTNR